MVGEAKVGLRSGLKERSVNAEALKLYYQAEEARRAWAWSGSLPQHLGEGIATEAHRRMRSAMDESDRMALQGYKEVKKLTDDQFARAENSDPENRGVKRLGRLIVGAAIGYDWLRRLSRKYFGDVSKMNQEEYYQYVGEYEEVMLERFREAGGYQPEPVAVLAEEWMNLEDYLDRIVAANGGDRFDERGYLARLSPPERAEMNRRIDRCNNLRPIFNPDRVEG